MGQGSRILSVVRPTSCGARRMVEAAIHLVNDLLPPDAPGFENYVSGSFGEHYRVNLMGFAGGSIRMGLCGKRHSMLKESQFRLNEVLLRDERSSGCERFAAAKW